MCFDRHCVNSQRESHERVYTMIRFLVVQICLLTSSTMAQNSGGKDVENPTKSDTTKYQWLVAIVGHSRQNDLFICTGAVISKTLILSSAWCLEQMPGDLSLFSGKAVESYKRPANVSVEDSSLDDSIDVAGCIKHLIYHPCYRKVQQCTNNYCNRLSWTYDLVVLETIQEMKTGITNMDMKFLDWKEKESKDCVFMGFDYARMYEKDKDTDQFFLVESKMKAGRGILPCKLRTALTKGVIWSKNRFVGTYRFLSMTGGYLTCGTQVAGIFLGKIDAEACSMENHHDQKSTHKFWMSWTYLLPHKAWIQAVIQNPKKFAVEVRDGKSSTFLTVRTPTCLIWFAVVVAIDWRHISLVFNAFNIISPGHF